MKWLNDTNVQFKHAFNRFTRSNVPVLSEILAAYLLLFLCKYDFGNFFFRCRSALHVWFLSLDYICWFTLESWFYFNLTCITNLLMKSFKESVMAIIWQNVETRGFKTDVNNIGYISVPFFVSLMLETCLWTHYQMNSHLF